MIMTSDFDVRNGLKEDDFDEHYMVLGLFGDHQNDDGLLPGARWAVSYTHLTLPTILLV